MTWFISKPTSAEDSDTPQSSLVVGRSDRYAASTRCA